MSDFINRDGTTSSGSTSCIGADSPNSLHDLHEPLFTNPTHYSTNQQDIVNGAAYEEPAQFDNWAKRSIHNPWTTSRPKYNHHNHLVYPLHQR